ncbi:MAG: transporter [Methylobacterium organophilum]|nr:transporter [Methylobacterium organophilum]
MRFDERGCGHIVDTGIDFPDLGAFGEGFLWLHFDLGAANLDAPMMEGRLGPQGLAASAFGPDNHQRVTIEGSHVGGVVADLGCIADGAEQDAASGRLHFVLGPRALVSGERRPVESPEATRLAAADGARIASPVLLLETLIGHVIAAIATSGARLSDELDGIEDHILDEPVRGDCRRLGPVRRDAVRLHRQLLGLRAVFHRLEEDGAAQDLPPEAITAAARLTQRLDALDRDMNLNAERSRLLQEELSARAAEQSNRQLYTLSVLTALFMPPTLVTGFFGINTKGLPLAENENGSLVVLLLALGSAVFAYWIIRMLGIRASRQ